ncbi:MAG: DUF6969 family protein [Gammaproteobacteria bacterium]
MSQTATQLDIHPFEALPRAQLERMQNAGAEIDECYRVLKKGGMNIVGECLKGQGTFYQNNHYPAGDVYDPETHAQYYYHNHRGIDGEHGHFHTFLRQKGMPESATPVPYDGDVEWPAGEDALSHLVAISMDRHGFPIGLFAVNRWVTGETWYTAKDVIDMIGRFDIDHAYPSWPVNRWITAMFILFEPQIAALLDQRDKVVTQWTREHADIDTYEDRNLEITGELLVSVDEQIASVHDALAGSSK